MADEGEYPKTDGDILYASEVNNFYTAPRLFFADTLGSGASGTAAQLVGSVFIGAGSMTNPGMLKVDYSETDSNMQIVLEVSGTGLGTGSITEIASAPSFGTATLLLGSPLRANAFINSVEFGNTPRGTAAFISQTGFDCSQDFVLNIKLQTNNNTRYFDRIFVHGYRGQFST